MNVILLGFRGSGKTAVGKKLADQLWATFVDVDEMIAAQFARPNAAADPLAAAAAAQVKILSALSEDPQTIVAASSEFVPDGALVQSLKSHTRLVYLKAEPAVLASRIAPDSSGPRAFVPLLGRPQGADPAWLAQCDGAWSAMADLALDTSPMTIETVVRLVVRMAM